MISYIRGPLAEKFEDSVVVEAGNVGYRIFVPISVLERLPAAGTEVKLYTHFQVSETGMSLFGFLDRADLELFRLLIGVNGVGKTTTIGKLALRLKDQGRKVILGAADTFRAAAIEQLQVWADRAGVDLIKSAEGSDPASVVFDTVQAGKARGADVIIIDTAGRLHNKKNLMEELNKISRVIDRELPDASKEVLLVLDATTGQNAVNQAKDFKDAAGITGIVLTKLDGTARGGVVLAINNELDVPVKFVGVGEQIDDLQPFDADAFAAGLFDEEEK